MNSNMGRIYIIIVLSFLILFIVNVIFGIINLYYWVTHGLQTVLQGQNFVERIIYSTYLKWILLADVFWLLTALTFAIKRKHYKTSSEHNYLVYKPILERKICIVIPAFNEEDSIGMVVKDYLNQKDVKYVIVIDNHSTDRTVEISRLNGAMVITKDSNKGYAHSFVIGLKESLKTDANIIVLTEADATYNAYEISKMVPFLDNCDMVIVSRLIQVLIEKETQLRMFCVWGNYFLSRLLQIKYFSLLHMGVLQISDVGSTYRSIRRDALEKIIHQFTYPNSDKLLVKNQFAHLFMTMLGVENDLRIVEIPVTFKKRLGFSKTESQKISKAIKYGLQIFWFIIKR